MMSTWLARTLREVIDVPIIFTYHTKFDIEIKKAIATGFLQSKAIKLMINNVEACDEVWVVSEGAADNLRSMGYRGECRVMENGVDFPQGRVPEPQSAEIRNKHKIPQDIDVYKRQHLRINCRRREFPYRYAIFTTALQRLNLKLNTSWSVRESFYTACSLLMK